MRNFFSNEEGPWGLRRVVLWSIIVQVAVCLNVGAERRSERNRPSAITLAVVAIVFGFFRLKVDPFLLKLLCLPCWLVAWVS
jgi:hypothetical protein